MSEEPRERQGEEPKTGMPHVFSRAFWTIDTVLGVAGLALSLVSTVFVFYLTAALEADLRAKVGEAQRLNQLLVSAQARLYDHAVDFGVQRTFEAYLDAFADDATRRRLNAEALRIALLSHHKHLAITAPEALPELSAEQEQLLKAYGAGDDTAPARIRASITRANTANTGAVWRGNRARYERRVALSGEIPQIQRSRDLVRAIGGFFQVFGIIIALTGQIAGRKAFANRNTPRNQRPGLLSRAYWTGDVTAVVVGTLASLAGTAILFFVVDAYQQEIDSARRGSETRGISLEVAASALDAWEDNGIAMLWVEDVQERRTAQSHRPAQVVIAPLPGETAPPFEMEPEDYVAHRRSFSLMWLLRLAGDNDETKYGDDLIRFEQLVVEPRSPAWQAFDGEIQRKAGPIMTRMTVERRALDAQADQMQGEQGSWRDFGGLLQMIGLMLAFAGNLVYFKRSA